MPFGEKQVSLELCRKCVFSLAPPEPVPMLTPLNPRGPGTHLKLLLSALKIDADHKGCKCKDHAARMDREGSAWCRSHMDLILRWLKREADRRKIPFSPKLAKRVVLLAIWRAEREAKRLSTE